MGEVLDILVSWLVTAAVCFAIVGRDEKHLSAEALARAWPATSRAAAILVFGQLALVVHFAKTRRSLYGVGLGLFWAAVATAPSMVIGLLIDYALPQGG